MVILIWRFDNRERGIVKFKFANIKNRHVDDLARLASTVFPRLVCTRSINFVFCHSALYSRARSIFHRKLNFVKLNKKKIIVRAAANNS